ncbi:MAG: MFS transporter [Bacteroidetes bacterium]|jgi:MFS family permease|nr:MFS transporter [Bacteroidota bacterium]MBT4399816.1 MFS transporter [Bacteroidota bacterium]MBT4410281.1 MFS transporter [Bacteroidota bacterium]MBT5426541.1 MFS transporter [Bacteroidota bacterium]MBT7093145.1 MFS transporter [Bacteroidota bacterium]
MTTDPSKLWTRDFIYLTLSIFLISTAFYFLMPTLPVFVLDVLEVEKRKVGLIIAIYTLAAMLVRPFAGLLLDLNGRKWLLIVSVILFSLFFYAYNWALMFVPLLLIRFLHGLQWGTATTAYFAAAVDIVPMKKRGRGIGYFGLAFNLAMAIGPALGLLIMAKDNYRALFISAMLISCLGIIFLFMIKFPPFIRPKGLRFTAKSLVAKKSLPVTITVLIIISAYGGILTFVSVYAREVNLDQSTGWFFTIMAVGMGLARVLSGQIFDRYGPRIITLFGLVMSIAGLWILALNPHLPGFLLASAVIGAGLGTVIPTLQTMANNVVVKSKRGVANSTFLTGLDLGIGLGSLYTGWLADLVSLSFAFMLAGGILLLGLIHFFIFTLPHYRRNQVDE